MISFIDNTLPSQRQVNYFRRLLIEWFKINARSFPWRNTNDPFKVLIAEIMLRRTKAEQVRAVYEDAVFKYPNLKNMARASDQEISKLLAPLGLNWRIRPFCTMVREIEEKYGSKVPEERQKLTKLPGVGDYVAGAVLSIAFNKKEWIVDTNVVRVFKRYFGTLTSGEARRDKNIIEIAKMYASTKEPRNANLAILDFAALICTSRNPEHELCPLRKRCYFMNLEQANNL